MLDNLPKEIVSEVVLAFFNDLESTQASMLPSENKQLVVQRAHADFVNLSGTNKILHHALNQLSTLKLVLARLATFYGLSFKKSYQTNLFIGIDTNVTALKKLIKLLSSFDIREFLFLDNEKAALFCHECEKLGRYIASCGNSNNPIIDFLYVITSTRLIGKMPAGTAKSLLERSAKQQLINSQLANDYFERCYPKENFSLSVPVRESINCTKFEQTYQLLVNVFAKYDIHLTDLEAMTNYKKTRKHEDFLQLSGYAWLLALAIDYKRTQHILDLYQRKIIPMREKKILTLAKASHPESFINQLSLEEQSITRRRFVALLASSFSKQIRKKKKQVIEFLAQQHMHTTNFDPQVIIATFIKKPQLVKKLSINQLLTGNERFQLLSHPLVNLNKWKAQDLFELLFQKGTSLDESNLNKLLSLPYLLTLFNDKKTLREFLATQEFAVLSAVAHGNDVLALLEKRVFKAYQLTVQIPDTDTNPPLTLNRKVECSLLQFLLLVPFQLTKWLIDQYSDVDKMCSYISNNETLHKLLSTTQLENMINYISNIDFLCVLDTLPLKENITILDALLQTSRFQHIPPTSFLVRISEIFCNELELMNAYNSGLLLLTYEHKKLLCFKLSDLKTLHQTKGRFDGNICSLLEYLTTLNSTVFDWIEAEPTDLIIALAQHGILQILNECSHWPERVFPHWPENFYVNTTTILIRFIDIHAHNAYHNKSFLQIILTEKIKHALVQLLSFIADEKLNLKEIILNRDFLDAVANADSLHPLFKQYFVQDWFRLFLTDITHHKGAANLFSYLTQPCNTIYWNTIKNNWITIEQIIEHRFAVISYIEKHPTKQSFFAKPKQTAQIKNTAQSAAVKRKRADEVIPSSKFSERYSGILNALNSTNNLHQNKLLSVDDERSNLQLISDRVSAILNDLEFEKKIVSDDESINDIHNESNFSLS